MDARFGVKQALSQLTNEIAILQNKALRIITFSNRNTPVDPLFKQLKILKFDQMIQMDSCLLALNHTNKSLPKTFENFFQYSNNQHNHNTRDSSSKKIVLPQVKTTHLGRNLLNIEQEKTGITSSKNSLPSTLKKTSYQNSNL